MPFNPSDIFIDHSKFNLDFDFKEAEEAKNILENRTGAGSDFLGWVDLPLEINPAQIKALRESAEKIRKLDSLILVGIGGSYLGARAVIEALKNPFQNDFPIHYLGHNLDASYYKKLLDSQKGLRYAVNVISKSGTTTEPAIAFRLLWKDLSERFDSSYLKDAVIVTTDAEKGSLRKLADSENLTSYIVPDDVGGRYSVLTPVGLLPIAAAGFDIQEFVNGASAMRKYLKDTGGEKNPAIKYAALRNSAYRSGKKIEIFASYNSNLALFAEWWKQLYGESEGKMHKGIFPSSVNLTTDLHSMGQWMQDGERTIFETVIDVADTERISVPEITGSDDGLDYLAGRDLNEINRAALSATIQAHSEGRVPCMRIEIPKVNEASLGAMMYMFEYACGISAYMLGVNPFDQPGVEAYKTEMFKKLKKPGY
ncbi:MAG: glucose-6-phosphate isomerase [Spirochaetia bacterium]|nr:glucose-6-phosphate isomerase [Spirochaetia bacterium]